MTQQQEQNVVGCGGNCLFMSTLISPNNARALGAHGVAVALALAVSSSRDATPIL